MDADLQMGWVSSNHRGFFKTLQRKHGPHHREAEIDPAAEQSSSLEQTDKASRWVSHLSSFLWVQDRALGSLPAASGVKCPGCRAQLLWVRIPLCRLPLRCRGCGGGFRRPGHTVSACTPRVPGSSGIIGHPGRQGASLSMFVH